MKLLWADAAKQDRHEILDYIAQDNVIAAIAMDELFERTSARLEEHPKLGRVGQLPGTRELIPHKNYRLIYEINGDTVCILALVHIARQWPPL